MMIAARALGLHVEAGGGDVLHCELCDHFLLRDSTVRGRAPDTYAVQETLKAAGVPTAVHYPTPLHLQPAFAQLGLGRGALPAAEAAAVRVMSLPMHPFLDHGTQRRVVNALAGAVKP